MILRFSRYLLLTPSTALLLACLGTAQTIEIDGQRVDMSPSGTRSPKPRAQGQPPAPNGGFGWGSNIGTARRSRAASQALKAGNYAQATAFAQQAAESSPSDPDLWFLLGYAARLSGRIQLSLDAYGRGLQLQPNSLDGLSGLAQTYIKAGNKDAAKKLLLQVVAANPRRHDELVMAGELFLVSGDTEHALSLLQRAESVHPEMRTELLTASAYLRLKQPDQARQMLDRAKSHGGHSPEVARAFAAYYRDSKDYAAAIKSLNSVPRKDSELLAELAWTYELAGDATSAARNYSLAADTAQQNILYQLDAASAWTRTSQPEKAGAYLDRAARLDPNHYRLHAIRADIARTQAHNPDAIREYQLALANMPESIPEGSLYPIELRMNLASLYGSQNDTAAQEQQMALAWAAISKLDIKGADRPEYLRLRAATKSSRGDLAGAEQDYKDAIALSPDKPQFRLGYAGLLWHTGRSREAQQVLQSALQLDPKNKDAMMSLGYLARELGDNRQGEKYFRQVASLYPGDYGPYLALGDLYVAERKYGPAESSYERAYRLAPAMPLIIAGGANNGIEWHKLDLTERWLTRAVGGMNDAPRIMRERERYLTWTGKYKESAAIGRKVVQLMPKDRDAAVYLGYDLYNLGRYDELFRLTSQFETVLPREANFPLLSGYVHKQNGLLPQAIDDFTRAIRLDPTMVEAYVNRGYVLNDTQNAEQAADDFAQALKLSPQNGVAHLGIAFSYLELHRAKQALEHALQAQRLMGASAPTHLALAGAYRQRELLGKAVEEYRAALKFSPDDEILHFALADVLFHQHHYSEAANEYRQALVLSPDDPRLYAQLANTYAHLHDRQLTYRYIASAEQQAGNDSSVLLATASALLALGDRSAAWQRFQRALDAPDADRVSVRLALAELLLKEGRFDDVRQQISIGFSEARVGEAAPLTADQITQAASLLLAIHDFDASRRWYKVAADAGADDRVVAVGLANTYLAEGSTQKAQSVLKGLGDPTDLQENYDYQLAMANVFRQQGDPRMALSAISRASAMMGDEDETVQRDELDIAAEAGLPINPKFSVAGNSSFGPIFEDETIYQLDARLLGVADPKQLPVPRYSYESRNTAYYNASFGGFPLITGFLEERNARGRISFPSVSTILNRDTYDTTFNSAVNPVLLLGSAKVRFNAGLQFTLRRDKDSAAELSQDLFRQFVYLTTNSLFNWLQISGDAIHEAGPFTLQHLSSRDVAAHVRFRVGRPWGNTALVTGYGVRDLRFHPLVREYFSTNTYGGIEHKFGLKWKVTGLAELIRSWRVQDTSFAIGQAMRPAGEVAYQPNPRWSFDGSFALSRGFGSHNYDNAETGFLMSYTKPWHRRSEAALPDQPDQATDYPLRFSLGLRTQSFYDFGLGSHNRIVPVVQITLF